MQENQKNTQGHKDAIRIKQQKYVPDSLEFAIEDMQHNLMTLTDLSIALNRERMRLDEIASDNKIAIDEIRVVKALLTVFCHETDRLQADATKIEETFAGVLSEHGVIPIVPETWRLTNSIPRRRTNKISNR